MEWKEAKKIINKDPEVLEELKNLEQEFQMLRRLIILRKGKKIIKQELLKLTDMK
jgi:hypothetical protein